MVDGLERPSDFQALGWNYMAAIEGGGQSKELKYVLSESVVNAATLDMLNFEDGPPGIWPGKTWTMDQDKAMALLGSPNGIGFAYMLMEHPTTFPRKTFSRVQAYSKSEVGPNLVFYLQDVD